MWNHPCFSTFDKNSIAASHYGIMIGIWTSSLPFPFELFSTVGRGAPLPMICNGKLLEEWHILLGSSFPFPSLMLFQWWDCWLPYCLLKSNAPRQNIAMRVETESTSAVHGTCQLVATVDYRQRRPPVRAVWFLFYRISGRVRILPVSAFMLGTLNYNSVTLVTMMREGLAALSLAPSLHLILPYVWRHHSRWESPLWGIFKGEVAGLIIIYS